MVAFFTLVVAGVCLRRKHQAKQKKGDEEHRDVPAIVAKPDRGGATFNVAPSQRCPAKHTGGCDVVQAALEAANNLARNSQFPGVCEAAFLVSTLVSLISNDRGRIAESEARLKRCHLLVTMLERAALVLGKVRVRGC